MDFFKYVTDPVKEQSGAEVTIDGTKYTIARATNRTYQRMLAKEIEANNAVLDNRTTPADEAAADAASDKIMAKVIAATILLGWQDGQTFKGQPWPYTAENAEAVLMLKDFRAKVMKEAAEFNNYKAALEEETGNV